MQCRNKEHESSTKGMFCGSKAVNGNTFIDLFAGCGGLSLGLMLAGWRGLFAVEKDVYAFETLKHNLIDDRHRLRYDWPEWYPAEPCDIRIFVKKYSEKLAGLRGRVDLIVGGPPCQGYSFAGHRKEDDPRNWLFRYFVKIVKLVQPPLLLLENVGGIATEFGKKRQRTIKKQGTGQSSKPFSLYIRAALERNGYLVYPGLVKAVDYGVPQVRPRYIMFGIRRALVVNRGNVNPFELVVARRQDFLASKGLPFDRPVTVKEAISDLETRGKILVECVDSPGFKQIAYEGPETRYQKLLHGDMNGAWPNSLRLANHREDTRARFAAILAHCRRGVQLSKADRERFSLRKRCIVPLDGDRPSHTLTSLPDDLIHYSEPRILTVREYARLQSFPDWFEFKGNYTTGGKRRREQCPRYTQVANAVPPFLAELFGLVLDECKQRLLDANREADRRSRLCTAT